VTHPAGFTLAVLIHRRRRVSYRHHRVGVTVTARAGRKLHPGFTPYACRAMHTGGLYLQHLGVTLATVHRIEPAPVPTLVGTDMAVEAFRRAMDRKLELREVSFVAVEAGVGLFGIVRSRGERYAGEEEGKANNTRTHSGTHCSRMFW